MSILIKDSIGGSISGNAATATALTTKSKGSSTQPVYWDSNGKPVACTYSLEKSVPADALFSDTALGKTFKTGVTTVSHASWDNTTNQDKIIPTMNFLAYWNGAYNSSNSSNLTYCKHGAFGTAATAAKTDFVAATDIGAYFPRQRMTNPNPGHASIGAIPLILALKAAGKPVYTDPEFAAKNSAGAYTNNSCTVYNNSNNGAVTITNIADNQNSANSSGRILQISATSGTINPGRGGFVQNMTSAAGKIFCQIFRAKIPTGYSVKNAENSMGNDYKTYWMTDVAGTGKWEWYCRITICGIAGTFSGGGHVYLEGSGAVTWYLSYCNTFELSNGAYDGLRTQFADKLSTARTIQLTGSVTGSGSFDGSGNLSISTSTNHSHSYLPLAGEAFLTGNLGFKVGDTDKFIHFDYDGDWTAGASWRVGMTGTGSVNANYFKIQSGTSTTSSTTWTDVLYIGQNDYVAVFAKTPKVGSTEVSLSGHTHSSITIPADNKSGNDVPSTYSAGLSVHKIYNGTGTNWPFSYGNALTITGTGSTQLALEWNSAQTSSDANVAQQIYIRSRRDSAGDNWSKWTKVITDGNIGSQSVASATKATQDSDGNVIKDTYVKLSTDQTITGLKTFESNSSTVGVSLKLKNKGWAGNMSTAVDFYNGGSYAVPNARIETKMVGAGNAGGTLIFYTQTKHASTNPNPNSLTERFRIGDDGNSKLTGTLEVTGIKKTSSSDSYILLGGGGTKAVSDFATSSHTKHSIVTTAIQAVAGSNKSCSMTEFITWLSHADRKYIEAGKTVLLKCTWDYAGNNDLVTGDDKIGTVELAGTVIRITTCSSGYYTIEIIGPTTSTGANKYLIYNSQGSGYSPGWRRLYSSSDNNIGTGASNYAAGNHSHSTYLPLTGGSLSGVLNVDNICATDSNGLLAYKPASWSYVSSSQWGVGATNIQGVIRSSNAELIHSRGGTNYNVLTSANSSISSSGTTCTIKINGTSKDVSLTTHTHSYLPLSGGVLTGNVTVHTGSDGRGLVFGTSKLNSLSNQLIWQSAEAIRFGSASWDWNSWAGLKYDSTNKVIYLGIPDNVIFNANSAQSGGKLYTPGVSEIYIGNGTNKVWHAGNDGADSGLDADKLDGKQLSDIYAQGYLLTKTTIDASKLNTNTWYPVTFSLSASTNTRIECRVALDSGTVPAWSSHTNGFSVRKIWEVNGSGWGTNEVVRRIFVSTASFLKLKSGSTTEYEPDPVRGVGQLTNGNIEYVYVRGGGKYHFYVSNNITPVLRTAEYTNNSQSVAPTTTLPAAITRNIAYTSDTAPKATKLATARTISLTGAVTGSTTFDGSANASISTKVNHSHSFNDITDAPNVYLNSGTVTRRVLIQNTKNSNGYISRATIGLTNPASKFSPVFIGVGTNDAGTTFTDYYFSADGSITDSKGYTYLSSNNYTTYCDKTYLKLAGGALTGKLSTAGTCGQWISGKTAAAIQYNGLTKIDHSSFWSFFNMKSSNQDVITFGGLGNDIGFYGYYAATTANQTDWKFTVNTTSGIWTFSKTPKVTISGTNYDVTTAKDIGDINALLDKINGTVV